MDDIEQAVKDALAAIYRVEVASNDPTAYMKETAYAIPIAHLVRLAELTGGDLPETLRIFRERR